MEQRKRIAYVNGQRKILNERDEEVPEFDVEPALIPESFKAALPDLPLLMCRDVDYRQVYRPLGDGSKVPLLTPCVVDCFWPHDSEPEGRCLAFAMRQRGRLRWFGVTEDWESPWLTAPVRQYVPVASIMADLRKLEW